MKRERGSAREDVHVPTRSLTFSRRTCAALVHRRASPAAKWVGGWVQTTGGRPTPRATSDSPLTRRCESAGVAPPAQSVQAARAAGGPSSGVVKGERRWQDRPP